MMAPEQLLIPRHKIIAPIPFQPAEDMYNVGDIITDDGVIAARNQHGDPVFVVEWDKYPHLFQPLPWYAERKKSEMPEFIKCDERVWKVTEWRTDIVGRFFPMNEVDVEGESENFANIKWHFCAEKFLPCTIAEYEQWKQSKNK
jgi:hypothetical protein